MVVDQGKSLFFTGSAGQSFLLSIVDRTVAVC